jgi:hypothetical protein
MIESQGSRNGISGALGKPRYHPTPNPLQTLPSHAQPKHSLSQPPLPTHHTTEPHTEHPRHNRQRRSCFTIGPLNQSFQCHGLPIRSVALVVGAERSGGGTAYANLNFTAQGTERGTLVEEAVYWYLCQFTFTVVHLTCHFFLWVCVYAA